MAISKLILNGETQMDVTSNTNTSNNMLSGVVGTKNDGTSVTGNIASKSSSDLTVSGATVTAPAGYYANAASKAVVTTTHPNPTASITSSTGVVTASHTQTTGYVTSGTTTGTLNLTTQAATTYNTSTADQTIASNRWLTGVQTIKSVTTSNLTAANIAEGVVVQVGDANNASRITQVTGTHRGATKHTATITKAGWWDNMQYLGCYVSLNGSGRYYQLNQTIEFSAGDILGVHIVLYNSGSITIKINGEVVASDNTKRLAYDYTLPDNDINIALDSSGLSSLVEITASTIYITENGTHDVLDYAIANVNVQAGSGFTTDQIAMRTISGDISGSATSIGMYAFYLCKNLTTASFPSCTSIGASAFAYCSSLTTASFPSCTLIQGSAFHSCSRLTTTSFPLCTSIGNSAFAHCYSLTSVSFPSCTSIEGYAFTNCSGLTTVSFPLCLYIGSYAFRSCTRLTIASFPSCTSISMCAFSYCSSLTTANFPLCTSIGGSAFYSCSRLTTVSFPLCTSISTNVFAYCYSLTTVSFPSCTSIGTSAFVYCYNLLSIYLLGSSVPFLSSNVFYSTPIGGRTTSTGGVYGSIFVPASLYNSYLTATNWSLYSDRIVSV